MASRLLGYHVRYLEPEALRAFLRGDGQAPGRHFLSRFDAAQWAEAVEATSHTGTLPDVAAAALCDAILRAGEPAGFVDLDGAEADAVAASVADVLREVLGDGAAGRRLLTGGLLDRVGVGRYAFGGLPLRVVAQQLVRPALTAARREAKAGWLSELLNALESAALAAARVPEAHLLLVPEWSSAAAPAEAEPPLSTAQNEDDDEEDAGRLDALDVLRAANAVHASDVVFVPGAPLLAHGPLGRLPLRRDALTPEDTRRLAFAFLSDAQVERFEREGALVTGFGVRDFGRYRLALVRERGAVTGTLRVLPLRPPALASLGLPPRFVAALTHLERGLVVVGGTSGSGRSTTLAALGQSLLESGAVLASVEEPVAWSLRSPAGLVRQVDTLEDTSATRALQALRSGPLDVLLIDLAADDAACELALDAASDGKLVVLALRGATVTALVHRLVAADAKLQRRRLAECLAAVLCQSLVPSDAGDGWALEAEVLVPSEPLRRHLRALDTMPPPAVLEDAEVD